MSYVTRREAVGRQSSKRVIGGLFDDDHGRGGPGGWWILPEVEVQIVAEVVRPDIAGWRRERLPSPWGMRPVRVVPDWICETLSPTHEGHDRVYKANLYAGGGVAFYWILDPEERVLEALDLRESGRWIRIGAWGSGQSARVRPFEAVELEMDRLFPPLPDR